jgi:hypothetical protein
MAHGPAPDFFINYLTSADGVGTSEIENHRISVSQTLFS